MLLALALACTADKSPGDTAAEPVPCEAAPEWPRVMESAPAGTFPQYRLDPGHQGLAPGGSWLSGDLSLTWQSDAYAIGEYTASKSSPTTDGSSVYVGIDDGRLLSLDAASGALNWAFETHQYDYELTREDTDNRGIHGTPAVWEGRVYVGDYSGWLYALDAASGALLWEIDLGGSIGASPALHAGHVFMAVEYSDPDGKVFVVDAREGCVVYETDYLGDHPHSSATVDPERGYLYVGANNGRFSAWDYVNQLPVWDFWMGTENPQIKSTAALDGDTVYITSWDYYLHALDADSGEERFAFQTGYYSMSSPSVYEDVAYFGSHDGWVYAVDADPDAAYDDPQDRELWSYDTNTRVLSSPTLIPDADALVVGSDNSWAYMLSMSAGEELWAREMEGWVSSVPTVLDNTLYISDAAGVVSRFDAAGSL
jgi:outer membrane protein assembly factor BamB